MPESPAKPTNVLLVSDQPLSLAKRREMEKKENIKIVAYHRIIVSLPNRDFLWLRRAHYEISEVVEKVLSDERISAIYYFLVAEVTILDLRNHRGE